MINRCIHGRHEMRRQEHDGRCEWDSDAFRQRRTVALGSWRNGYTRRCFQDDTALRTSQLQSLSQTHRHRRGKAISTTMLMRVAQLQRQRNPDPEARQKQRKNSRPAAYHLGLHCGFGRLHTLHPPIRLTTVPVYAAKSAQNNTHTHTHTHTRQAQLRLTQRAKKRTGARALIILSSCATTFLAPLGAVKLAHTTTSLAACKIQIGVARSVRAIAASPPPHNTTAE